MSEKRYYQDGDNENLIVRVWYEGGKCRGEYFEFKNKKWYEADDLAWDVATDIYNNHPLGVDKVEEITGVKPE